MKRIAIVLAAVLFPLMALAQNSAVDQLFEKYRGKEGITTIAISPEILRVVKAMDIQELDEYDIPFDKLSTLKVLAIEDDANWEGLNFYEEIRKDLNTDGFAEVMTVNDGAESIRMWMKADQAFISEFLLIVGGDDKVLVHITGHFSMNDLQQLAGSFDEGFDMGF